MQRFVIVAVLLVAALQLVESWRFQNDVPTVLNAGRRLQQHRARRKRKEEHHKGHKHKHGRGRSGRRGHRDEDDDSYSESEDSSESTYREGTPCSFNDVQKVLDTWFHRLTQLGGPSMERCKAKMAVLNPADLAGDRFLRVMLNAVQLNNKARGTAESLADLNLILLNQRYRTCHLTQDGDDVLVDLAKLAQCAAAVTPAPVAPTVGGGIAGQETATLLPQAASADGMYRQMLNEMMGGSYIPPNLPVPSALRPVHKIWIILMYPPLRDVWFCLSKEKKFLIMNGLDLFVISKGHIQSRYLDSAVQLGLKKLITLEHLKLPQIQDLRSRLMYLIQLPGFATWDGYEIPRDPNLEVAAGVLSHFVWIVNGQNMFQKNTTSNMMGEKLWERIVENWPRDTTLWGTQSVWEEPGVFGYGVTQQAIGKLLHEAVGLPMGLEKFYGHPNSLNIDNNAFVPQWGFNTDGFKSIANILNTGRSSGNLLQAMGAGDRGFNFNTLGMGTLGGGGGMGVANFGQMGGFGMGGFG